MVTLPKIMADDVAKGILFGKATPYAKGLNVNALLAIDLPAYVDAGIAGVVSGVGAMAVFFPDTCEVAAFSLVAGSPTILRKENHGDGYPFDPDAPNDSINQGLYYGVGVSVEEAIFTSTPPIRGRASADSFQGVFRTVLGNYGIAGASLYWGLPKGRKTDLADITIDNNWFGTTVGVGAGFPVGLAVIDWEYKMLRSFDLDADHPIIGRCACAALALAIFSQS
jgi:hypothetical protein